MSVSFLNTTNVFLSLLLFLPSLSHFHVSDFFFSSPTSLALTHLRTHTHTHTLPNLLAPLFSSPLYFLSLLNNWPTLFEAPENQAVFIQCSGNRDPRVRTAALHGLSTLHARGVALQLQV